MTKLTLTLLILLVACAAAPRTTTEEERATAHQTLTSIQTVLVVLLSTGDIKMEAFDLANEQVGELRQLVQESATVAISWQNLMQRVANMAIRWAVPAPEPQPDTPSSLPTPAHR